MALDFQNLPIDLGQGIDQASDGKQVLPSRMSVLRNRVFTKLKQLKKVFGFTQLTNNLIPSSTISTSTSTKLSVHAFNEEKLLEREELLYHYVEDETKWKSVGRVPRARARAKPLRRTSADHSGIDSAIVSHYLVVAWVNNGVGVFAEVYDRDSGQVILSASSLNASAYQVKVCQMDAARVTIYAGDPVTNVITAHSFDTGSPTAFISHGTLVSDYHSQGFEVISANSFPAVLVYGDSPNGSGNVVVNVIKLAADGATSTGSVALTGTGVDSSTAKYVAAVVDSSDNIYVAYQDNGAASGLWGAVVNSSLTPILTFTNLAGLSGGIGDDSVFTGYMSAANQVTWFFQDHHANFLSPQLPSRYIVKTISMNHAGVVGSISDFHNGVGIASRVFTTNDSTPYLFLIRESELQGTLFCVRASDGQVVSRHLPGEAGQVLNRASTIPDIKMVPNVVEISSDVHALVAQRKNQVQVADDTQTLIIHGAELVTVDLSKTDPIPSTSLVNQTIFAGGVTTHYDGATLAELGFHLFPENLSAEQQTTLAMSIVVNTQGAGGAAENTTLTFPAAELIEGGSYFTFGIALDATLYYGYFIKDGNGADPAVGGATGIPIEIDSRMSAGAVAVQVFARMNVLSDITVTLNAASGQVTFQNTANGATTDAATTTVGAGRITAGTYQYRAVFEWFDKYGRLYRSAPSPAVSVTVSGTKSVAVNVPQLTLTEKSNITVAIYRTEAAGSVFYRVSPLAAPVLNENSSSAVLVLNERASFFRDVFEDSEITDREILYTEGGVLENISPPATDLILAAKNRLWLFSDEQQAVWYSKQFASGLGIETSDALTIIVDQTIEPVACLAELDDKILFFKESAPFFSVGDGPNDTGAGGAFSLPEKIPSATGASTPNWALIPAGVIRQTARGYFLLGRNLEDVYIGKPVEDFNTSACLSADVLKDVAQARFLTGSSFLIYDYEMNQWSERTLPSAAVDAVAIDGVYHVVRGTDCRVWHENSSLYTDNTATLSTTFTTGWVHVAGLTGFQRVQRLTLLGEFKSNHTVTIEVGYDYATTFADTYTYVATGSAGDPLQIEVHLSQQKCQALRIKVTETATSGTLAEGNSWTNFQLLIGIKRGLGKLPSAQRI